MKANTELENNFKQLEFLKQQNKAYREYANKITDHLKDTEEKAEALRISAAKSERIRREAHKEITTITNARKEIDGGKKVKSKSSSTSTKSSKATEKASS